jgi:hypothetical protein
MGFDDEVGGGDFILAAICEETLVLLQTMQFIYFLLSFLYFWSTLVNNLKKYM